MAWMIVFTAGTFRRPKSKLSFTFEVSPEPQSWPRDVVAFAVSKGWAEVAKTPAQETAKRLRSKRQA